MFAEYDESVEEAASIARVALPWISQNDLPAIPTNYAVAYEHVSGRNKNLSRDADRILKQTKKLTQELLDGLFNKYFSNGYDVGLLKSIRTELNQIFTEALLAVSSSDSGMQNYREKLSQASKTLSEDIDLDTVKLVVTDIITETRQMQESSKKLQNHLDSTCKELESLRTDFQKIQHEVFNDPLTGILNRRGLDKILGKIFEGKQENDAVSFLMIDIDHFKKFNDTYGHVVGDEVLRFVARTLSENLKGRDIVARYGGEEFIVILPETELKMAERVALKLCHAINSSALTQKSTGRKLGYITASIGATSNLVGEQPNDIIARADKAMYEAKGNGRNRVFSFIPADKIANEVAGNS